MDYLIQHSLNYSENYCNVIYVINPFSELDLTKKLLNCINFIYLQNLNYVNIHITIQLIPLEQIITRQNNLLNILKEIAFSVFTKTRRIYNNNNGIKEKNGQQQLHLPVYLKTLYLFILLIF